MQFKHIKEHFGQSGGISVPLQGTRWNKKWIYVQLLLLVILPTAKGAGTQANGVARHKNT